MNILISFSQIKAKQMQQVENYDFSVRGMQKRIWQLEQDICSLKNVRDI